MISLQFNLQCARLLAPDDDDSMTIGSGSNARIQLNSCSKLSKYKCKINICGKNSLDCQSPCNCLQECASMEHCSAPAPIYTPVAVARQGGRQQCGSVAWLAANWVTAHPSNVSNHDVTPTLTTARLQ